jgi:hypothetical protein
VARRTDDNLTRESRLVRDRHPPTGHGSSLVSCTSSHTHTHTRAIGCQRAAAETPIAPPGLTRRWGDLSSREELGWTYAARSGPSAPASAPRIVFVSAASRPRLQVTTFLRPGRLGPAGHTPGFTAKAEPFARASRNPREPVMSRPSPFVPRGQTKAGKHKSRVRWCSERPSGLSGHLRDATPGKAR